MTKKQLKTMINMALETQKETAGMKSDNPQILEAINIAKGRCDILRAVHSAIEGDPVMLKIFLRKP